MFIAFIILQLYIPCLQFLAQTGINRVGSFLQDLIEGRPFSWLYQGGKASRGKLNDNSDSLIHSG